MANSYSNEKATRSGANLTPRIINTFFLLALQHYFTSHPEYRWCADDNKTEIDIHPEYEEDDNIDKGLPVVVVQSGPISIMPAGVGSGMFSIEPRVVKYQNSFTKLDAILDSQLQLTVDGSIVISVIGMSHDDVSELSFEIATFLMMIKYDSAAVLQIQNLGNVSVSAPQASSKTGWTNRHIAQISIPYVFTITRLWKPYNAGELLKEVDLHLRTKVSKIDHKNGIVPGIKIYEKIEDLPGSDIYPETPDIEEDIISKAKIKKTKR